MIRGGGGVTGNSLCPAGGCNHRSGTGSIVRATSMAVFAAFSPRFSYAGGEENPVGRRLLGPPPNPINTQAI